MPASGCTDDELLLVSTPSMPRLCASQLEMLRLLAEAEDRGTIWEDRGAQIMAHWVSLRYGITYHRAERWIAAAHALKGLPLVRRAFERGDLSLDKVMELTRFATDETEDELVGWAQRVSPGRIRHKAELLRRAERDEGAQVDSDRTVTWSYYDQGRRFGLTADLPAADGAVLGRCLDRLAERVPVMPGEEGPGGLEARRADALIMLASSHIPADPDPDRATVIVHARVGGDSESGGSVEGNLHGAELEGGPELHPLVAERLLCSPRVQVVGEDATGQVLRLGRMRREPPEWMLRQVRYRDSECTFPGCAHRRYAQAHHITWWEHGGSTDLDNLVLICSFHHKLVHEYGWRLSRTQEGEVRWFHPDGTRYRAGPAPPPEPSPELTRELPEGIALSANGWSSGLKLQRATL